MIDSLVDLKIDNRDIELAAKRLGEAGSAKAVGQVGARAINKTLRGVRFDTVKAIGKEITPKAKVIRSHLSIYKANSSVLTGHVVSSGNPLGLIHYKPRQTAKGVSVHIKKKKSRKLFPNAYIRRSWARSSKKSGAMVQGGKSVFQRDYHGDHFGSPRKSGRKNRDKTIPWARLDPKYRLPISRKTGPGIPEIMSNKSVMSALEKKALVRLKKNWDHELQWKIKKLLGR